MKAVVLVSGGLDSLLALKIIVEQNIPVLALHFTSPFYQGDTSKGNSVFARQWAQKLGVDFETVALGESHLEIVRDHKHGYGKHLNPCIDCRILQLNKAKEMMVGEDKVFFVTGEVLGQRPMSQHRQAMRVIEKESGLEGFILRPLCAQIMEPTIPEQEGWVDRNKLLALNGRTRRPQLQLAKEFGLTKYPNPAGGCLLTEEAYAQKMRDLFTFGSFDLDNVELLKTGRHFRLSPEAKLIVGRNEKENTRILELARAEDIILNPVQLPGPTALGRGAFTEDQLVLCARIVSRYTSPGGKVSIQVKQLKENKFFEADNLPEDDILKLRI